MRPHRKFIILFFLLFFGKTFSQTPVERFLCPVYMKGASVSLMIKDMKTDKVIYSFDKDRELIPASVLKTITTATALEILGEQFRYESTVMYDGLIKDGLLDGNLYIRGSGDPTLGSSETGVDPHKVMRDWIKAVINADIRAVAGSVIADESIFDTEGVSMKWMREDIGSYYGQGSYGINIFDNRYSLFLQTFDAGSKPEIIRSEPEMPNIIYYNFLTTNRSNLDSLTIVGFPFSNERFLYGTVPSNRSAYRVRAEIPEPSLFLSQYFTKLLTEESIKVTGPPTCYRILDRQVRERKFLTSSYSSPIKDLVVITNHRSHNLYADALLKTIGLNYRTDENLSSMEKGVRMVKKHWEEKGLDVSSLWMFDGCGLAATDKVTASFICDLLTYMYTQSPSSKSFIQSLPRVGIEGTVSDMFRGSALEGKLRLKSGSMSRVRSYAGYVENDDGQYAVAIIVNNFSCTQTQIRLDIERLLLALF